MSLLSDYTLSVSQTGALSLLKCDLLSILLLDICSMSPYRAIHVDYLRTFSTGLFSSLSYEAKMKGSSVGIS